MRRTISKLQKKSSRRNSSRPSVGRSPTELLNVLSLILALILWALRAGVGTGAGEGSKMLDAHRPGGTVQQ